VERAGSGSCNQVDENKKEKTGIRIEECLSLLERGRGTLVPNF
jgi:hypothetical protein